MDRMSRAFHCKVLLWLMVSLGTWSGSALWAQSETPATSPTGIAETPSAPEAVCLPLRGLLDRSAAETLSRSIRQADRLGAVVIALDIASRSGDFDAAAQIVEALVDVSAAVETVAFVDPDAVGPASLVALACDRIVMGPRGKLGGARTLVGSETEVGLTEAYLRAEFRDVAERQGRSAALAEAMADPAAEVWLIRHVGDETERYVLAEAWQGRVAGAPEAGGEEGIAPADWVFVRIVAPAGRPLLMTARDAERFGFSTDNAADVSALAELLGVTFSDLPRPAPVEGEDVFADESRIPTPPRGKPLPPLPEEVAKAYLIPIEGAITESMAKSIRRKVVTLKGLGAELVVFRFNTPGGLISAARDISGLIKNELADVRTVAFVDSEAISAGALLAVACDEIIMVPRGKIGDCAPIIAGPGGPSTLEGTEREKIETYLRTEFRDSSEANGYWPALAESMVSDTIEVWLIENVRTGERQFVKRSQWRGKVRLNGLAGDDPDNPTADWRLQRVAVPAGTLLTMTTEEALDFGFARTTAADLNEFGDLYNVSGDIETLGDTWSEDLVDFLTSPAVTGILFLLMIFFGYIEMHTPGFGVGGTIALICLGLLFGSRYLTGLAQWWEIAAFALGVVLLLIEVFVIPGFGVAGITGILLCLVGLLAMLVGNAPDELPVPEPGIIMDTFLNGVFALTIGLMGAVVLCALVARYLPQLPVTSRLVLSEARRVDTHEASTDDDPLRRINAGDRGVIVSACRPAGKARFGEDLIDVIALGEFIGPGVEVTVLRNEGNRLVVESAKQV